MAIINFPASPSVGQQYTFNGVVYQFSSQGVWIPLGILPPTGVAAPGGRLTMTSGTPVMTTDVINNATFYYTPYIHDQIWLYNGAAWIQNTFTEVSIVLDATNALASTHYDVFAALDSGTFRIGYGPAWATNTIGSGARGTGAGTTELQMVNGRWTNKNTITLRYDSTHTFSVAVNQALYLGTVFINTAGVTLMRMRPAAAASGTACKLFLWNAYNRVLMSAFNRDNTASWTPLASSFRRIDNNVNNSILYVDGLAQSTVQAFCAVAGFVSNPAATDSSQFAVGIARNWSSGVGDAMSPMYATVGNATGLGITAPVSAQENFPPALGAQQIDFLEYAKFSGTGTVTAYGSGWNADLTETAMTTISLEM